MGTVHWDTDLAPEAVKRLRPEHKAQRALTALTRKVELLEHWARNGIPPNMATSIPWDRAKLRRWSDAERKLWSWADPQIDAGNGKNAALMERFRAAIKILAVRGTDKGQSLKRELDAKERIIANLERQNAELLDQIRQFQRQLGVSPIERR